MQERSEDLRVFVEVLQSLTSEPDDLLRLRASEAALREKVGKLEADWNEHHLQQTINKLQQAEVNAVTCFACPTPVCPPPICNQHKKTVMPGENRLVR